MLLSIADALTNLESSRFRIVDTSEISPAQLPDEFDWPDRGIIVMQTTLTADTQDTFTGTTLPAGTVIHAPLATLIFEELPGAPRRPVIVKDSSEGQVTEADYPRQTYNWGTRAWAFCCHDHPDLASGREAIFYLPEVLETICRAESHHSRANRQTFDPITYGTGAVALLRHPGARGVTSAQRDAAHDSWVRTRGPDAHLRAALMGSANLPDDAFALRLVADRPSVKMVRLLRNPYELASMRRRLWTAFLRLPRGAAHRLPVSPNLVAGMSDDLLPMGGPYMMCTEGSVVQSDAAWSLRRDWRVRRLLRAQLADPPEESLVMDLPLVCFTGTSHRANFIRGGPLIVMHNGARFGIRDRGVFCLGWGAVPVWTLVPGGQVPASLLAVISSDGTRGVVSLPTNFRVLNSDKATTTTNVVVTSRAELHDALAVIGASRARVEFTFPGGVKLQLDYAACRRGFACTVDAVVQPIINLPALEVQPTNEVTLGVQLALATDNLATLAADMYRRIFSGQCPEQDIYGHSIREAVTKDSAERERLAALRPQVSPYTRQGTDPWLWDPREQNPVYAMPHVYSHASVGLISELNRLQ